jgi:hypothetical protein
LLLLFGGNKPPFGAFHGHRCFPFLTLRWPRPALGYHRYPIRRVERVRGGHTFPKIDADERTTIRRDPIILADQTGVSFIGVGRRVDSLDQLGFGCARRHFECPHHRVHNASPACRISKPLAGSVSKAELTR